MDTVLKTASRNNATHREKFSLYCSRFRGPYYLPMMEYVPYMGGFVCSLGGSVDNFVVTKKGRCLSVAKRGLWIARGGLPRVKVSNATGGFSIFDFRFSIFDFQNGKGHQGNTPYTLP